MYVFDSHSCDERGLSAHSGTSVLISFEDLSEVQSYIRRVYVTFEDNQRKLEHFQTQYIDKAVPSVAKAQIVRSLSRKKFANRVSNMRSNRNPAEKEEIRAKLHIISNRIA